MTYRELFNKLKRLDDEAQLQCADSILDDFDVTVHFDQEDECFPVKALKLARGSFVLDENHPVLIVER